MENQWGWLKRYRSDAESYLKEDRVRIVDFSGMTYQFEVKDRDSGESEWPFFQFDEKGQVKDAFCSCEAEQGCVHQAAALIKIYGDLEKPLHLRFAFSFWKKLCEIFAEEVGYEPSNLEKKEEGTYIYSHRIFLQLKAKTKQMRSQLKNWLSDRPRETPENSLKFSNLSQEEVSYWKEGRPSSRLKFELSFWSDLAKDWMLRQEEKTPYQIDFSEDSQKLPTHLHISWKDLEMTVHLSQEELEKLIPTLQTVHASLAVIGIQEADLASLSYEEKKKSFHLQWTTKQLLEEVTPSTVQPKHVGEWLYIPQKGFFSIKKDDLFHQSVIAESSVELFLERHFSLVERFLPAGTVHSMPLTLSYHLFFDKEWNLHLEAYLFKQGDLQDPLSGYFGRWVYLPKKGFFRIKEALFKTPTHIIGFSEVSSFVNHFRIWLQSQEKFETHLAGIETRIEFSVSKTGDLRFFTPSLYQGDQAEIKDFGEWIYVDNVGFFSKKLSRAGNVVKPGMEIPACSVSTFIEAYREEVESIPGFFSQQFPLHNRGLMCLLLPPEVIKLKPMVEWKQEYKDKFTVIYDNFVYVEAEGFSELPQKMRLPDEYLVERTIQPDEFGSFFKEEWKKISSHFIHLDNRLEAPHQMTLHLAFLKKHPEGGLRADLFFQTEYGKIPLQVIIDALEKKRRFVFTNGGRIDLLDERLQWIRRAKLSIDSASGLLSFSTLDFMRLDATEELFEPSDESPNYSETHLLLRELREGMVAEIPHPVELKSELRLYQQTGLAWLWFLYRHELSGLLCDEMGLGKTHQAMGLMACAKEFNENKQTKRRFLIVCPTSVIYHWQDKLTQYIPSLPVHIFHGFRRTLANLPEEGILLTTYGIVRVEREKFKDLYFDVAIFDEIQNAKNPRSRLHSALANVQSKMRLGLTGTPIENNLLELKALFDVVLPGYMPSEARFKELFLFPIEKEGNHERKELLKRFIRPFILRRLKKDVLQELPEKSEDKSFCELSTEQKQLYQDILQRHREGLISDLKNYENPVPYLHVFSVLSTLKQICNHPALIAKDPKNYKKHASGKWDLFVELIEEAYESKQKVVVFTQYLFMLDIMGAYFQEKGWSFAEIRGSTTNRREQLIKFQEDPSCLFFIGTLGAAGVGIDLTAASTVILYDRWWNAARENQAIDRVHRIGQKRGVQVYKLITKNTIEEKIDQLILHKEKLLAEVIESDEQSVLKKLTREELIELLKWEPNEQADEKPPSA